MRIEAGKITFGSDVDTSTGTITDAKSVFRPGDQFAYRAFLSEPAGTTTLRLVIAKLADGGSEQSVIDREFLISDPKFQVFSDEFPVADIQFSLQGAGSYAMRILRDTTLLAEGKFEWEP